MFRRPSTDVATSSSLASSSSSVPTMDCSGEPPRLPFFRLARRVRAAGFFSVSSLQDLRESSYKSAYQRLKSKLKSQIMPLYPAARVSGAQMLATLRRPGIIYLRFQLHTSATKWFTSFREADAHNLIRKRERYGKTCTAMDTRGRVRRSPNG